MSLDWIKWCKGLTRRTEVLQIAAHLQVHRKYAAATLMEVWAWADGETETGWLPGVSYAMIDAVAEHENFANAMEKVGWIQNKEGGVNLPRYTRHNADSAKKRAKNTIRQSRFRARQKRDSRNDLRSTKARLHKRRDREEDGMHGVSMKQGDARGGNSTAGDLHIEAADLITGPKLGLLFRRACDNGIIPPSEAAWFDFVRCSRRALRRGDDPPAMMATYIREWPKLCGMPSLKDEADATKIVRETRFEDLMQEADA